MNQIPGHHLTHLRRAIELAQHARDHGNHPFGALLVAADGRVLLEAENSVNTARDCTGHAELNLVRQAGAQFSPQQLAGPTLYSSCEPCAMCAGAIHWSGIRRVVYALAETALYEIVGPSPEHLVIPCRDVFARAGAVTEVVGPARELEREARTVHAGFWQA